MKLIVRAFEFRQEKIEVVKWNSNYRKGDPRIKFDLRFLKYVDPEGRFTVLLYANHLAPCFGARLITKYCEFDPRVKPMLEFILHWAKSRGILNPLGGYLSSYAFVLMIIFFLQIQNPPVLLSIQLYCKGISKTEKKISIPSFAKCLKDPPPLNSDSGRYNKESIVMNGFDFNFNSAEITKIKKSSGFPKNNEGVGALIAKFFYYFGVDYPELVNKSTTRKMSIEKAKYVPINLLDEKDLPFAIEDPIDPTYNPGYTVKMGKEYNVILYEFQRAYLTIACQSPMVLEIPYQSC